MAEQNDGHVDLVCAASDVVFEAASADKGGTPRFSLVAYTGGAMNVGWWEHPVVIDLAGIAIPSQKIPVRFQHSAFAGVGHTETIAVSDGQLLATGVISRDTPEAREVLESSRRGFPWQVSVGASAKETELIREGVSTHVNGREFSGPVYVVRSCELGEVSFVDLGADRETSAKIAANKKRGLEMAGEKDEGRRDEDRGDEAKVVTEAASVQASARDDSPRTPAEEIEAIRRERRRQATITAMIANAGKNGDADLDALDILGKTAISEKWTPAETELSILRLMRPIHGGPSVSAPPNDKVLAATLLLACGVNDERLAKDRDFGPNVIEAAWGHRQWGLHDVLAAALKADGCSAPHGGNSLFGAVIKHKIEAGFSSVDLPGILGTVGNKLLLDSFTGVQATYERIAAQADFSNFLTYTTYRLDNEGEFAPVGPDGEIKHGSLSETGYTNRLAARGQILTLTRENIVNDDLQALKQLYGTLGRKARIAVERALYDEIMESGDVFYTAGRGNRLTSTSLSVGGLAAGEAAFMGMLDADGEPIFATPAILLVPPGQKYLGEMLYASADVYTSTDEATANPFRGRFRVESSPYLAMAAMTGYSATTWYLLADPNLMPAFQVAYLQNRRVPTIETADAAFNTLGVQMRCYFDFGVAQLDYRGALKISE